MFDYEKLLIDELLIGKEFLKNDQIYTRSYLFVKKVLEMPEWEEEKFQPLLTSTIWTSNYEKIQKILAMPEWEEEKFRPLLTSNIWTSNYEEIQRILSMPEWEEEKFQSLLTSNIWTSNYEEIHGILKMDKLKESDYQHLLSPSIFGLSYKNIVPSIELFEEYKIGKYVTNRCLRRNVELQRTLIEYLIKNGYDLLVEKNDGGYKLNPILNASNTEIKRKYGIDVKEISKKGLSR